jgi:hypothetical protein
LGPGGEFTVDETGLYRIGPVLPLQIAGICFTLNAAS